MAHTITESMQANATAAAAYEALTTESGYRAWWAKDCEVDEKKGGEATLRFDKGGNIVTMKWRIDDQKANRNVLWTCIGHNDPRWVGTRLDWTVKEKDGGVEVTLNHSGWSEDPAEMVRQGWRHFVSDSLKSYLETGVGKPW